MSRKQKTEGLEHLVLSIISFNGSGYADRSSPNDFLDSYKAYNEWKGRLDKVVLLDAYWFEVIPVAEKLLEGPGPGQVASDLNWAKFNRFRYK